ncbi:cyclic nucleotide-binding domain-containing protein [Spirochaetia bacterium 38H-sp]|uniref:Cyclic nucleotide-binding domain-containing protein n=1 Tax=Rarispira pelagica TaxID=3141764 RepID=A0ABU9UAY2_9SPIR
MNYKKGSIIYFEGDVGDKIYVLQKGVIDLASTDIETGQEIHERVGRGEFFGVKSALGHFPREETVSVLSDAYVLIFTIEEFEEFLARNPRILIKMLQVFSMQLRRIHKRVQGLLAVAEEVNPEEGLFVICKYYMEKQKYPQALYALRRYKEYYPSGMHIGDVEAFIKKAELLAQRGRRAATDDTEEMPDVSEHKPIKLTSQEEIFYDAQSLMGQEKYQEALDKFKELAKNANDADMVKKALFEIGRCLCFLKNYDACIKHFTSFVQKYGNSKEVPDALFHIGQSYEGKGDKTKASSFYKKILSMVQPSLPIARKSKQALREIEESI